MKILKNKNSIINKIFKTVPCIKNTKYSKEVAELLLFINNLKKNNKNNELKINIAYNFSIFFRNKINVNTNQEPIAILKKFIKIQTDFLKKNHSKKIEKIKTATHSIDYYNKYFKNFSDYEYFKKAYDTIKKRLIRNNYNLKGIHKKIALDAGAGGGRFSIALKRLGFKKVYGIDYSSRNIEFAISQKKKKKLNDLIFKRAHIQKLPFKNHTFDFILCNGVVHHTSNYKKSVSEIIRVLKPGGQVYFQVMPNPGGINWDIIEICRYILKDVDFDYCFNFFLKKKMKINVIYLFLDHMKVKINKRYHQKKVLKILKANGAKKNKIIKKRN